MPTDENYMVLESLNLEKSTSKLVHLLTPKAQTFVYKLGRGNDQDLKLNDISVSRSHAKIVFKDGKFSLFDNISKFGTLVQIQNELELKPHQTRIIQVGRTLMNVSLKPVKRHQAKTNQIMYTEQPKYMMDAKLISRGGLGNGNKQSQLSKVSELCEKINNA